MANTIRMLCFACMDIITVRQDSPPADIISEQLCPRCWRKAATSIIVVEMHEGARPTNPAGRTGNLFYVGLAIASAIDLSDGRALDDAADDRNVMLCGPVEFQRIKQLLDEHFYAEFGAVEEGEEQ